ncbi:MAG: VWA domain-containing protein, partial [Anaerolineales bacterium]|nr:VWA domain-containing protein [Anaerolineales bacterium]
MKIFPLALMIAASSALADTPAITIHSASQNPPPIITLHSAYDFKRKVSLKINLDPAFMPADVLLRAISRLELFDNNGVRITSGVDIDPDTKLVIGFSGGSSEIIKARSHTGGMSVLASFKDHSGKFISAPKDQLAVYDHQGNKLCFDYKSVNQTPQKMTFILLLDRSASMASVMDEVKRSAITFLKSLPPSAQCAVASFNHGFTYHNEYFQSCNLGDFKLDDMIAEGGTDLLVPLLRAHESLGRAEFADHQKAVIVITDGQITQNLPMQDAIL